MNKIALSIVVVLTVTMISFAQRPEDAQRPPRGRQDGPPGGPPGGLPRQPPGFHLMTALDANGDGKISAKEIDNAVAALQKLDRNKDGKLSSTEIGWPPPGGFRGFGGGRGGDRGGFPGRGGGGRGGFPGGRGGQPNNDRPQRPATEEKAAGNANQQPPDNSTKETRFFSVAQLKSLDSNGDGKISKDEIPKGLRELILSRVDANKDGVIDLNELSKVGKPEGR